MVNGDFLESSPVALIQTDDSGVITATNAAALRLLNRTSRQLQGINLLSFFAENGEQVFKSLQQNGFLQECGATFKGDSLCYVVINANSTDNGFKTTHHFLIRDITATWLQQAQSNIQFEITKILAAATSIGGTLEKVCETLCKLLSFEVGIVWRINEKANRMSRLVHKVSGDVEKHDYILTRSVNVPLSVSIGFPASLWFNGKGRVYTDLDSYETCFGEPSHRLTKTYPSVAAFPICIGSRIWGIFSLFSTIQTPVSSELLSILESIGYQIGSFVDRIEAYEAYLKSQERYYVAITGSNDGIWDWDLTTNEVFFSPRYREQLGFEANELDNHFDTFRSLCHVDDYQQVMAKVQAHLDKRMPYEAEFRCITKDGSFKWISARGQAIWDAQGRAIRMAGSHRDISELKAGEQARREYEQKLLASESMFRQLAENIREVFWIIDSESQFIYASPTFTDLWQEDVASLYEDNQIFFNAIIEEDRKRIADALQDQSQPLQGFDLEFRIENKNKELRWIWARLFPVLNSDKRDRLYGIAHDITEKKEVEQRVSEFYSTVSHELRTPLTSIRAALGLIEGGITGEIGAETMDYVRIARDNSDRLIRLINDILDIRRLEANKLELKIDSIVPADLISKTVESLNAFAAEQGVSITFDVQTRGEIVGDYDRLVQVLTNLISNAIKYTPRGKNVEVSAIETGRSILIKVVDQGPGIAEEHIQDLFGLFQQLSCIENDMNTGSGLGLAISKALIEKLGGAIGAESQPGHGATFWFELPALEVQMPQEKIVEAPLVLLMEDSDSIAMILNTIITRKGYNCQRAATIAQARELASQDKPDLLFADINLPDGNGLDFVNWLHERYQPAIPVIVLSGAEANISRVKHSQSVDWVKKPFETAEVISLLRLRLQDKNAVKSDAPAELSES